MFYRLRTRVAAAFTWFWVALVTWTGPRHMVRHIGRVFGGLWISLTTLSVFHRVTQTIGRLFGGLWISLTTLSVFHRISQAVGRIFGGLWISLTTLSLYRRIRQQAGRIGMWLSLAFLSGPRVFARALRTAAVDFWLWLPAIPGPAAIGRGLFAAARWFREFIATRSWPQFIAMVLVTVLLAGAGTLVVANHLRARQSLTEDDYIRQSDLLLLTEDVKRAQEALEHAELLAPGDPRVRSRLAALQSGRGDADDAPMLRLLMRRHSRAGRSDDAAEEARKLLALLPEDWDALCVLAHHALLHGDRTAAAKHLAKLPAPGQIHDPGPPGPGSVAFAINLYRALGDAPIPARITEYVIGRILPSAAKGRFRRLRPSDRLDLMECYAYAVSAGAPRTFLLECWEPLREQTWTADLGGTDPARDRRVAGLLEELVTYWGRQAASDPVNPDYPQMAAAGEADLKPIWRRLAETEPGDAAVHKGRIRQLVRLGDYAAAESALRTGLKACPDDRDLRTLELAVLSRSDPPAALAAVEKLLAGAPDSAPLLRLTAETAAAAGRPDRALEACRRASRLYPALEWPRLAEAGILLERGSATEAAGALEPIRTKLRQDAVGAALYVRSLCRAGAAPLAEEFLAGLADEGAAPGVLAAAAGAIAADGPSESGQRWASRLVELFPEDIAVRRVLADVYRRAGDRGNGTWDREFVLKALTEYRWVREHQPDDLTVLLQIARLELDGMDAPDDAYRTAEPLLAYKDAPGLAPELAEFLGEMHLGVRKFADARRLFERAASLKPSCRTYCGLAAACIGLNQAADAEVWVARAAAMPKSASESARLDRVAAGLRKS